MNTPSSKQRALRFTFSAFAFMAGALFTAQGQDLGQGLVSYWPLDDGLTSPDNGTLQDLESANVAELTTSDSSAAWLTGPFAKSRGSLRVDGFDTFVTVPSAASLDLGTNAVTLSLWVKISRLPADLEEGFGGIFDSVNDAYVLYLDRSANELRFKVATDGGAQRPGIPAADLTVGEWMHVVGVYDGDAGETRIYANGELKDTHVGPTGTINPGQVAGIGRNGDEDRFFLGSDVDEIALWNRALSDAELQAVMTTGLLPVYDSDSDGMRDAWETSVFGSLFQDGSADGDGDGLTDALEYAAGTAPSLADSDADGLSDGDEVTTHLSDPLKGDTDGDGLTDDKEVAEGTNPTLSDTDGDGLSDAEEVNTFLTDATQSDTDGDGFSDTEELAVGTDPKAMADAPSATTVFLVRSSQPGESWLEPTLWSDGAAPVAGKDYVVPGRGADTLLLAAAGETVFPGDSLTLAGKTQLLMSQAGNGVITIPSLVLNGGRLVQEGTTAITLAGAVNVIADSVIKLPSEGGVFTLASTLNGTASLTIDAPDDVIEPRSFVLDGAGSTFTGDFVFDHISINARTAGSLGNGNLRMASSTIDIDYNAYNPQSTLTLTGAGSRIVLDQFLIFQSLVIAETAFPDGTYDFAAWEALDPNAADFITDGGGAIVLGGDSDSDRLLDEWELRYFDDLTMASGGDDTDSDTLTNEEEFIADTDPTLPDTDADSLADAAEVNTHGTNPLVADTDGDGLTDAEELNRADPTNPLRTDTDTDGLSDGDEVNVHGTDPLLVDSDSDGHGDAFELQDSGDPLNAEVAPRLAQLDLLGGLISFWPFNDGVASPITTTISDVLGSNNLSLVSPDPSAVWLVGDEARNDGSLTIEGTETFVPVPNTPSLNLSTEAVTISAWIKLNELPSEMASGFGGIFDSRNDAYVLYLDRSNAELRFKVTASGGAERPGIPEADLSTDEWLHVAGVYDGAAQESRIYLNGELMDTHNNPTGTVRLDQIAGIGRNGDEDASYFSGAIDDLGIWDVALTSPQILKLIEGPATVNLDSDDDGLLDSWEMEFFGNLDQDAAGDSDSDGLSNNGEFLADTQPTKADTDDDGVNDGDEVDYGSDPVDADSAPFIVDSGLGMGLLAYWPLDEPTNPVVVDLVGLNPLTLTSPDSANAWLLGAEVPSGAGLQVDGINDYLVVPNAPALDIPGDTLTLAMWVKLDQLPSELEEGFGAIYDSSNDAYVFYMDRGNAELRFKVTASGAARPGIPEAELTTNEWIHITGVYDGPNGEARIYKNGELMGTIGGVSGTVRAGQTAGIGRQGNEEANFFSGGVDDIAIWKRVLSLAEITALASGAPIFGPSDDGDADFRIVSVENAAQELTLRWNAVEGRVYTVQYTDDLASGEWTALATDLAAGASGEMAFTDSADRIANTGFYRIEVQP